MKKWGVIFSLLSIINLYNCSGNNKRLKIIDLQSFSKDKTVVLVEDYNDYFTEYSAIFLEKTDSLAPMDVKQIKGIENDIFILIKNQIRRYNLNNRHLDNSFQAYDTIYDFISFDIDRVTNKLYALDANYSKIIYLDTLGNVMDHLKLDPAYKYDQLALLDKSHILITTCSFPVPITFVANIESKIIKQIDKSSSKSFTPDKQLCDTIHKKMAPINIFSQSNKGILVKYFFDDIVYKYNNDSKEPVFRVNNNKAYKAKQINNNVSSKLGQITLSGLWQLSEEKWLLRWSQVLKYKGSLTSIPILTICNDQMGVYNNSMSNNSTIMEWHRPGTIFSIGAYDLIYVDTHERKLFKVMSNNLPGIKLPEYLKDFQTQNNLILSWYLIK
ncbi:MAG: hypothetical protein PHR40_06090 [Bacteroidales bacterium]|nr:hypothetical protein [Bacteroidales bacterium]